MQIVKHQISNIINIFFQADEMFTTVKVFPDSIYLPSARKINFVLNYS